MKREPKTVKAYKLPNGTCPIKEWRSSIRNKTARQAIDERVDRTALGNPGDCESVGDGVYELRVHIGPGYRVYFAYDDTTVLLLLVGGDKSSQKADIITAKKYLKHYMENKDNA